MSQESLQTVEIQLSLALRKKVFKKCMGFMTLRSQSRSTTGGSTWWWATSAMSFLILTGRSFAPRLLPPKMSSDAAAADSLIINSTASGVIRRGHSWIPSSKDLRVNEKTE